MQVGKMLSTLLFGLAWGMQRVREQQQGRHQVWLYLRQLGAQHAGLTSAVGMASQEEAARDRSSQGCERILQADAVAGGVAGARGTERPGLAIGKIAAQHSKASGAESLGQGHEQRSLCVRSRTVRQDEAIAVGDVGQMEVAAHFGIEGVIDERADGVRRHEITPASYSLLPSFALA